MERNLYNRRRVSGLIKPSYKMVEEEIKIKTYSALKKLEKNGTLNIENPDDKQVVSALTYIASTYGGKKEPFKEIKKEGRRIANEIQQESCGKTFKNLKKWSAGVLAGRLLSYAYKDGVDTDLVNLVNLDFKRLEKDVKKIAREEYGIDLRSLNKKELDKLKDLSRKKNWSEFNFYNEGRRKKAWEYKTKIKDAETLDKKLEIAEEALRDSFLESKNRRKAKGEKE